MKKVTIFSKTTCPYCIKAKDLLLTSYPKLDVYEVNLENQSSYSIAREEMVRLSHGETTVPQIFLDTQHLKGGFTGIKKLIDSGKFDELLAENEPIFGNDEFPAPIDGFSWKIQKLERKVEITEPDF